MIIRYFSDLHLEFIDDISFFISKIKKGNNEEVCVCAGDIGNPYEPHYDIFMQFLSNNFTQSFIITGNHEYYNKKKSISEINYFLQTYFSKFNNITFLNNNFVYYNNYCFIGTTLWTNVSDFSEKINDAYSIKDYIENIEKYNENYRKSVEFLQNSLENNKNCVVITHHLPSYLLVDNKFKKPNMEGVNQWFYSNLDNLINDYKSKIKCWIYGHTHIPSHYLISDIPFICNPIGYPCENKYHDFTCTFKTPT
uniref:Calcineurin-like phosphoesterase domain-containing protein n=1 Tax=viral metagenome TaxID=1070528 RepID=A0A6C0H5I3_9ZZZZ